MLQIDIRAAFDTVRDHGGIIEGAVFEALIGDLHWPVFHDVKPPKESRSTRHGDADFVTSNLSTAQSAIYHSRD